MRGDPAWYGMTRGTGTCGFAGKRVLIIETRFFTPILIRP